MEPQNKPSVRTIFPELPLAIGTNADLSDSFSPTATALRGVKYSAATRCERAAIVVGQRYCGTAVTARQFHGMRQDEFVVLFAAGPLRHTPLNFFPVPEKVGVSCGASMFAEADTTTGLETD